MSRSPCGRGPDEDCGAGSACCEVTIRRPVRERDVERHLVKRVEALGGEVRKAQWIGRRGAPDRRVMLPGRLPTWVELKAPGEVAEPHQVREHNRMRRLGELVEVLDSVEAVDAWLASS
jgi:hypothetical protein